MGSGAQVITLPEFMPVLGHDGNIDFTTQAYWLDYIAGLSLTTTAKIKLGGTQVYGTGADYLLPTAARCIVAVRPKLVLTTPTANQAVLATLKVESGDLHMGDFEVFASPLDSGLGTAEDVYSDPAPWWPLMQPCNGGEKMQFYGTAQIANTAVVSMSVDVLLCNYPPEGFNLGNAQWRKGYGPVQAKIAGINSGGGPTNTGTAALTPATDGGVTISAPKKRILMFVGVVVGTTPAASKPLSGQFNVNASEMFVNPQRFAMEPIQGFLGATTAGALDHLTKAGPMNLGFTTNPSTPKATISLDTTITTTGNFEMGYIYIDNP